MAPEKPNGKAREPADECIAVERDLWFDGMGFPHPANAAKEPDPWRKPSRSRSRFGARQRQS